MRFSLKHNMTGVAIINSQARVLDYSMQARERESGQWDVPLCDLSICLTGFSADFFETLFSPTFKFLVLEDAQETMYFEDAVLSTLDTTLDINTWDGQLACNTTWVVRFGFFNRIVVESEFFNSHWFPLHRRMSRRGQRSDRQLRVEELDWRKVGF